MQVRNPSPRQLTKRSSRKVTSCNFLFLALSALTGVGNCRNQALASSHQTHEMTVPNEIIGCVIGKGGSKIAEIRYLHCTNQLAVILTFMQNMQNTCTAVRLRVGRYSTPCRTCVLQSVRGLGDTVHHAEHVCCSPSAGLVTIVQEQSQSNILDQKSFNRPH